VRKRRNTLAPPTTSQKARFPSVSFRSWKGHGGPEGIPAFASLGGHPGTYQSTCTAQM
jgi:hypothetical protein